MGTASESEVADEITESTTTSAVEIAVKTHYGMGYEQRMEILNKQTDTKTDFHDISVIRVQKIQRLVRPQRVQRAQRPQRPQRPERPGRSR